MHWIDWSILGLVALGTLWLSVYTRKFTRSVADFVTASRCAGRYVLGVSEGIAMIGAISVVLMFEIYYRSGFSAVWWSMMQLPIGLVVALTGWVIYRYRQTKAMTLAQFFEARYSRNFRIFTGILAYLAGIINYGIFPAVSARFFIYFCGLPTTFGLAGFQVSTFPVLMIIFLSLALAGVFLGGQIAVMISDFIQGIFCNIVFLTVMVFCFWRFDWNKVVEVAALSEKGRAMFDPMLGGIGDDFGFVFFFIGALQLFFNNIGWQGRGGFNSAAKSPHEAKMAKVLGTWRQLINTVVMVVIPVFIFALMQMPGEEALSAGITQATEAIPDVQVRTQMFIPVAITKVFPIGLMGLFAAMMFCAMVTTDQPYIHSWGSILVQDVIQPIYGKPLPSRVHMWLLRGSISFVAIFAFFFSLLFQQTTYIAMFFAITAAIFMGGAGAVIIGGLYWRKGTTTAAWATMIIGAACALTGIVLQKTVPDFPLNGMEMTGVTMGISIVTYVVVSLLTCRGKFNLDRMLHRGEYAENGDEEIPVGWKAIITPEFTRNDKLIYLAVILWTLGLFGVFLVGTLLGKTIGIPFAAWAMFWKIYVIATGVVGGLTTIWFAIGGFFEIREIFATLANPERDLHDDGWVGKRD